MSDKVIILFNVILSNLEEVEAIVSDLIEPHRADQSLELIDLEGLCA